MILPAKESFGCMKDQRKVVLLAMYLAAASVLHVLESWIPIPTPLPGLKLGLANIVSLIVLIQYGWQDSLRLAVLRVVVGALFGGMVFGPAFLLSMGGAVASVLAMAATAQWLRSRFSIAGISIIGAVVHHMMQILVAAWLVSSGSVLWYLPYLLLAAVPVGLTTGVGAHYFCRKLAAHCG